MLKVAEKLNGTLESKRSGRFHIFTTYGDFELLHANQPFNELLKEVELQISFDLKVGIGTGYTVFDAMENVEFAFNNYNSTIANNIIVVDQDKKPFNLSSGMATYFTVEKIPDSWKKILEENNYTPTIPAKIYHFVKLKQINQFNSELITGLLKNTSRNTRRILSELAQMGLLEVFDEESSGKPGRPKKVYRLCE